MTGRLNRASGLFAQPMVLRLLDHEAAQARRHHTPLTLMRLALMLPPGLDEAAARSLHQLLAQVLNTRLRAIDLPGHLEDDYLIVLPITEASGAHALALRLAHSVAVLDPAPLPSPALCLGLAYHPGGPECDGNQLADQATLALREAQRRGPHSVVDYSDLPEA